MIEGGITGRPASSPHLSALNHLAALTVFTESLRFGATAVGEFKIQYVIVFGLLISLAYFLKGIYMDIPFTLGFLSLTAASVYNVFAGKDQAVLLAKQVFGIYLNATLFYMVMKANDWNVERVFKAYLNVCLPAAYFGIVQEFAYLAGIAPIYDLGWLLPSYGVALSDLGVLRVRSVCPEPAFFAFSLLPACFAALVGLFDNRARLLSRWNSLIVLLALILSFSSIGYMGLALSLLCMLLNYGKAIHILAAIIVVPALCLTAYFAVPDVKLRVDGTLDYSKGTGSLEEIDLSNFALYTNLHVATRSFSENPLIGSGLGSHLISYNRFIGEVVDFGKSSLLLNKEDASSLLFRLISETGVLGLGLVAIFILKSHAWRASMPEGTFWVINNAILVLFIIRLIRFGHYFDLGFFMFFWMYLGSRRMGARAAQAAGAPKAAVGPA